MYENISYCGAGKFVSHGEWIHPNRIINSYEIIFVLGGTVYIEENGKQYQLKKNDLLLLEPKKQHFGYKGSNNTSFFWAHFTGGEIINPVLKYQNIKDSYNLSLLFKQLIHYRTENQSDECLNYLIRLILIECFSNKTKESTNNIVSEISAWITANSDIPLSVEQISKHFGYNADYISRLFKINYGKSLKEYINDIKINYIKQLLLTSDLSLSDIAYNTGFTDYKYFLKFFKYHEGITPTQFLKAYPKTHLNKK